MHLYGQPVEMDAIHEIAKKYHLFILEDAAEALGAEYSGHKTGGLGDCGIFSFFGNKIITCGEGGMVTTQNDELAAKCRLYRGQGMDLNNRYWFPVVGYSYRITNIQAAIGLAQLENISQVLAHRQQLVQWYQKALEPLQDEIILPNENINTKHVYWMYTIYLRNGGIQQRNEVINQLDQRGIETRPVFYPLYQLPPYSQDNLFPVAESWAQRGINLPTHAFLTEEDVNRIARDLELSLGLTNSKTTSMVKII